MQDGIFLKKILLSVKNNNLKPLHHTLPSVSELAASASAAIAKSSERCSNKKLKITLYAENSVLLRYRKGEARLAISDTAIQPFKEVVVDGFTRIDVPGR
jgi:hypothetical protein